MLRCSGCGDLVSEFAARCPACHRSLDDVLEVAEVPAPVVPPVTDWLAEQPPVRTGRRPRLRPQTPSWLVRVLAAMVVSIMSASTGAALESLGHRAVAAELSFLSGEVVAISPAGGISWVDPRSGRLVPPPGLVGTGAVDPVAVSPDGATLLDSNGDLLTFDGQQVRARPTLLPRYLSTVTAPAQPSPFADGNRAVVLLTRLTQLNSETARLVDLSNGRSFYLGRVDGAAGDPQTLGAFVSIPTAPVEPRKAPTSPDGAVELRSADGSSRVLAASGQLARDVGWASSPPVQLQVYPNPTGDAVAIVLEPLTPQSGNVPMVILNRAGQVLATVTPSEGPVYESSLTWSPAGHQIAYETRSGDGYALAVATETGIVETDPAPRGATSLQSCTWAPASTDVVCAGQTARRSYWVYATPASEQLIPGPSAGVPVDWLDAAPPA